MWRHFIIKKGTLTQKRGQFVCYNKKSSKAVKFAGKNEQNTTKFVFFVTIVLGSENNSHTRKSQLQKF